MSERIGKGRFTEAETSHRALPAEIFTDYHIKGAHLEAAQFASRQARDAESESEQEYLHIRRTQDANTPAAIEASARWHEKEDIYRQKVQDLHEVHNIWDGAIRNLSVSLINDYWHVLAPLERRAVDAVAADKQSWNHMIYPIVKGLISGNRIADEETELRRVIAEERTQEFSIEKYAADIYGGNHELKKVYSPDVTHSFGTKVFGIQRSLSFFVPEILTEISKRIPKKNAINKNAIRSYLEDIVGNIRGHLLSNDAVSLLLDAHVTIPYTDEEFGRELAKQHEVAPFIAEALVKEDPNLIAVTAYGPVTRKHNNYAMFHPREGLQLGACFYQKDEAQISQTIEKAKEIGKKYKVKVKTGTAHQGMFGGEFYTWHFATANKATEEMWSLDGNYVDYGGGREFNSISDDTVDRMHELQFQLLNGTPLAIRDDYAFKEVREPLQQFSVQYSQPIFSYAQFLKRHFDQGYPHPIEYQGSYKG